MTNEIENSNAAIYAAAALLVAGLEAWAAPYLRSAEAGSMAAGCAVLALVLLVRGCGSPWRGLAAFGAGATIAGCAWPLLLEWEAAGQPRWGFVADASAVLLGPFVQSARSSAGGLLLDLGPGAREFVPHGGLLGLRSFAALLLVVGALHGGLHRGGWLRDMAILAACAVGVATVRFALGAAHFESIDGGAAGDHHTSLTAFWNPWSLGAALVATALLASSLRPLFRGSDAVDRDVDGEPAGPRPARGAVAAAGALVLVGAASVGAGTHWSSPPLNQGTRVLVDDRLGGAWEPAGRLLTEDRFGDFSTYSFAALVEQLSHRFALSVNATETYDRGTLEDFDVLLLKTPHEALGADEVTAIQDWVQEGGGLFVIGDHTDLGGMNTFLNRVVEPAGIRFGNDFSGPIDGGGFLLWQEPLLPEHPISCGMEPFGFMTGCSLGISGNARAVMTVRGAGNKRGDYSKNSHFGTGVPEPADPQGIVIMAAASEWGAGRVLAFADSTVFSSFAYGSDSHADFCRRGVTWLAQDGLDGLGALLVVLGLGCAALGLLPWLRGFADAPWLGLLPLVAVGVLGGAWVARSSASVEAAVPARRQPVADVGFVVEGGKALLPPVLGSQPEPITDNLMTFFLTPMRLGQVPGVVPRDVTRLDGLEVLVIMNPDLHVDPDPVGADWYGGVRSWVDRGGRLIVLSQAEHHGHEHEQSAAYLNGFTMVPRAVPLAGLQMHAASDAGDGEVLWIVGSEGLSVEAMGHCMAYPGAEERAVYDFCYRLFGAGVEPRDRRTYAPNVTRQ